jgi:hypothetical protein
VRGANGIPATGTAFEQKERTLASDATFIWNGGTGSYNDPAQWTITQGSVPNSPNYPLPDDTVIIPPNASDNIVQATDLFLGPTLLQSGEIDLTATSDDSAGIAVGGSLFVSNSVATTMTLSSLGYTTYDGTIEVGANATLMFDIGSDHAHNAGVIAVVNGGTLIINSTGTAALGNAGTMIVDGGVLQVNASLAADHVGSWRLTNGATAELNTPVSSGQTFDYLDGNNDLIKLDQLSTFQGILLEMGGGDIVDLGAINVGTIVYDGTNLTLEGTSGATLGVLTAPNIYSSDGTLISSGTFSVGADGTADGLLFTAGTGGDLLMTPTTASVACFAKGTRIQTDHGPVPVEMLQDGDRIRTALDDSYLPVTWIGHRVIDCTRHPRPKQVWPVRIAAGAFGRGQPVRDLWLSPDHAVYVNGVLIPVKYLVNGANITQVPRAEMAYYHIELTRHDVVLAEKLPTESYLPGADRSVFTNSGGAVALHPDMSSLVWEAEGCAPLVVTGPELCAVQEMLGRNAQRKAHWMPHSA